MCPSAPRVCSEPGGQKPVISSSLDRIDIVSLLDAVHVVFPVHADLAKFGQDICLWAKSTGHGTVLKLADEIFGHGIANTLTVTVLGREHTDGLAQDCSNSTALAVELQQSCAKPSIQGLWMLSQAF